MQDLLLLMGVFTMVVKDVTIIMDVQYGMRQSMGRARTYSENSGQILETELF